LISLVYDPRSLVGGGLIAGLLSGLMSACAAPDHERSSDASPAVETAPFRDAFVDRAAELGLAFRHQSGARGDLWMPETTGSGVGLIDYDGDGDLDVYLVQGGWFDDRADDRAEGGSSGVGPSDRLYRNDLAETGRLAFHDVTEAAGLLYPRERGRGYGQGVAVGDYDRDGDDDLFVTALGRDRLLRNDDGRFSEVSAGSAGWDDAGWSTGALFVDLNQDGSPELFVARYLDYSTATHKDCFFTVGTRDYCKPLSYSPVSDRLYRRRAGGSADQWVDVSAAAGLDQVRANGLGVVAADLEGDARPEIFVANDQMANHLWTHGDGFALHEDGSLMGVAVNAQGLAEASMGVVVTDFDRDGWLDLLMTHLRGESHTLYRGLGGGMFDDGTDRAHLSAATLAATGFGVATLDFDNDGWVDLAVAGGAVHLDPSRPADGSALPLEEPDQLLRNDGGRFQPVAVAAFEVAAVGRGLAVGDLDDDGDSDLVFNDAEGSVRVLINTLGETTGPDRSWLGVELLGVDGLDPGEGLTVTVTQGEATQTGLRRRGGSYLSSSDPRVLFGLGDETQPVVVSVHWQDGSQETFGPLEVRRYHRLQQGRSARDQP
jgi:hypothetical protein